MMTKKCLALIAILLLTIIAIFGVLAVLPPRPGVTKSNFDRIQKGMTPAEVEAVFGVKPLPVLHVSGAGNNQRLFWHGDDGAMASVYFINGSIERVEDQVWSPSEETILDKIRRWFHLT